jgi:flagellar basal body-associated protein FliL
MDNPQNTTSSADFSSKEESKPIGPIIGIVIILAVLAIGGLYFWGSSLNKNAQNVPIIEEPGLTDQSNDPLDTMSESNDLDSIINDLSNTNVDTVDADLQNIEGTL